MQLDPGPAGPTVLEIVWHSPAEVFVARHVAAMAQLGCHVKLVAWDSSGRQAQSASVPPPGDGPHCTVIPKLGRMSGSDLVRLLGDLSHVKDRSSGKSLIRGRVALAFIRRLRPELIHFHFGSVAAALHWIPMELGLPYTVSLRGSDVQVNPLVAEGNLVRVRAALNGAAGIHTVSDELWALAQPYLDHAVFHRTVYTAVPPGRRRSQDDADPGMVSFVAIGRLHWRKNFVALLQAFRNVLDAGLAARLTIIGSGPDGEALRYWTHRLGLTDIVQFPGKLDAERIQKALASSTAYIQSSIVEGFSNATAEAMACGLPVFATAVGGTAEIIQDGVNGFLLDPLQPLRWEAKLKLATDADLMRRVGASARQTSEEKFSPAAHAAAFVKFFEHVLGEKG